MAGGPETHPSLLLRIRDPQDQQAWGQFVEVYSPLIFGYLKKLGLQEADAADVTQESLRAVVPAIRKLEYNPAAGTFRGWLLTVVRRKLSTYLAKARRPDRAKGGTTMARLLQRQPAPEDESLWDEHYRKHLLAWAADQVRGDVQESTWHAFRQTALEGKPAKHVAEELGMSIGAVYLAKSRYMHRVKERIEQLQLE